MWHLPFLYGQYGHLKRLVPGDVECVVYGLIPHIYLMGWLLFTYIVLQRLCEAVLLDMFAHMHVSWDGVVVMSTGVACVEPCGRWYTSYYSCSCSVALTTSCSIAQNTSLLLPSCSLEWSLCHLPWQHGKGKVCLAYLKLVFILIKGGSWKLQSSKLASIYARGSSTHCISMLPNNMGLYTSCS